MNITAPGESVWRALSKKDHGSGSDSIAMGSGTSYAVATVAGACATWLAFHGRALLLKKYGPPRLAGIFRRLLVNEGYVRPDGWDTNDYGAGILDVEKLLRAPLPPAPKMTKKALFPGAHGRRTASSASRATSRTSRPRRFDQCSRLRLHPTCTGPARRQVLDRARAGAGVSRRFECRTARASTRTGAGSAAKGKESEGARDQSTESSQKECITDAAARVGVGGSNSSGECL